MNKVLRDLFLAWLGINPRKFEKVQNLSKRVEELDLRVQYLDARLKEYIDCGVHSLHGRQ